MAHKTKGRKTEPQLRVKATDDLLNAYDDVANSYGYSSTAPFVRRLLDAARQGDRRTGIIHFFLGSDGLESTPHAAAS